MLKYRDIEDIEKRREKCGIRFFEHFFNKPIYAERSDYKTEVCIKIAKKMVGKNERRQIEEDITGQFTHMGMSGKCAESLFFPPDAVDNALNIERKIKFRMQRIPSGKPRSRCIACCGNP